MKTYQVRMIQVPVVKHIALHIFDKILSFLLMIYYPKVINHMAPAGIFNNCGAPITILIADRYDLILSVYELQFLFPQTQQRCVIYISGATSITI
jgi:hypothetical protein